MNNLVNTHLNMSLVMETELNSMFYKPKKKKNPMNSLPNHININLKLLLVNNSVDVASTLEKKYRF